MSLLFFFAAFITFSSLLAETPKCTHICECLPPKVPYNSSSPPGTLQSCLQLQGLFTFAGTIYLIAGNCVYELRTSRLLLAHSHPRLFLYDQTTSELTVPIHWKNHSRYQNLLAKNLHAISGKSLLQHVFYLNKPQPPPSREVDTFEVIDFRAATGQQKRYYLRNGQPTEESIRSNFISNKPFNVAITGDFGYIMVVDSGTVRFYDHGVLFNYQVESEHSIHYFLCVSPENANDSEAFFANHFSYHFGLDPGWRSIPSAKSDIPFGLQYNTLTVLVDVHEEKVYIFTYQRLDFFTPRKFPIRVVRLQDFLSCEPRVTAPPPLTTIVPSIFSMGNIVFVLIASLGIFCLLGVSICAFFQRSSLTKAVVKRTKNVRYNYQPIAGSRRSFGWSGGSTSDSATPTDATKRMKKKGAKEKVVGKNQQK